MRRNSKTTLETHAGADPNADSRRIAIFVHFDPDGIVHDYVMAYLESLKTAGFKIWLMSNAPHLSSEAIARVKTHVTWIHRRNNFGYDFGAYKDGILSVLERENPDQLVICNDSVYGPLRPLGPLLERATSSNGDVWGMTDSHEAYLSHTYPLGSGRPLN